MRAICIKNTPLSFGGEHMDITGTICFVLSGSVCIPLVIAALRRLCAVATSKPANVPNYPIYYYLPDGLTFKQQQELMFLRWLYESGTFVPGASEDVQEDTVC
jgi:hypothetical protein